MKNFSLSLISVWLLLACQAKAQTDSANFIYEAPMEYRGGQLYSNFVKIRLIDNTVIPTTSHSQSIKGTSAIAAPSLKLIFDSHVLAASGDPANVGFQRENLDDYVHTKGAEEIFEVSLGVTMNIDNLISDLRSDPNIESVNPPYCIYAEGLPNNNLGLAGNPFANWHIDRIQAPEAWVFLQPYAAVPDTVAVVDGDLLGAQVYEAHSWISGKVINEPPINPNCPSYGNHPTMVASCITAKECASSCNQSVGAGRNFVKVSSHGTLCGVNNAFLEIWNMPVANRPRVINCSWVFLYGQSNPPFFPIGMAKFFNSYSSVNLNMVVLEQLIAAGTIVVASSGNGMSAPNSCSTSPYCFSLRGVGYPFSLPGVIGVGATSPNNMYHPGYEFGMGSGDDPTNYPTGSSSGANWNYNYNNPLLTDPIDIANQNAGYLDITAPGDEIDVAAYSGTPYSLTGAGTSFASPIVAAAAASMLLVNPALTQADVTRILTETADKVNYNPNGMTLGDLNSSIPYTKGYTYSNTGNVTAGGFYDPTLDYVMGHGRLNMLSAVMNSAGLATGGFTVTNSGSFPVTNVVVHNVNDHSYLTGSSYNLNYEYDAIMNQNGSKVYFNSSAVSLSIDQDATFRIMNGAKMNFTSSASLLLVAGTPGKGTKYVIGNGGSLALNDNTFNITGNAYLEAAATGSLSISNATVVVQSGGTLHIKSNAYLSLTSTGKIIVNTGGYLCIEPGATIVNNGVIDLTASLIVGVNPAVNTPPGSGCLAPCDIAANTSYSGSGALNYSTCLAFTGNTVTNVSCLAANSGSITVNVTGGTLPYSYAWSNSATTQSITGLAAGNYTVTVTDAASNTITTVFTVAAAATVTATASSSNVFCMGGLNSGTASAGLLGGTGPYTYSWSTVPTQTTQLATGLAVGIYTVTVTDALGCAATKTVSVINDPINSPMTITVNTSSVSCPGGANGSATVSVVGGNQTMSPTFSAYWYNSTIGLFANTHVPSGLTGGNYTVSVVDGSGCTQSVTVAVNQPSAFSSTVTMTPATSCTATTGSATITLTGGTPAYSYSWNTSPVQTASVATGLGVGIYSVTVTDAHSCMTTASVMVTNSSLVAGITSTNVSCYGFTDGIATATVTSGGTPPYTYQWGASAGYQTTQTVSSLGAGTYYVMITDALGNCGNATVNITAPASIVSTSFVTSYFCNGATIVTFPSGGTGPYTYTWSPGSQTTQTITGVSTPGYYSVVITDSHGCRSDAAPYYYGYATYIPAMPPLMITATYTSAVGSCTATNASASVSSIFNGSAPYSYLWSSGGTTQTVTGLSVGVYWVQVTDANGCAATATINVTNSAGPALTESHTNATCASSTGAATVTPIGGTAPYTYSWTPGGQTTQSVSGLATGTYSVLVTDATGHCNSILLSINPPTPISFGVSKTNVSCSPGSDGTASVGSVFGGSGGPYTYSWSPGGQTTQTATGLTPGAYTVQVTDAGGCVNTGTVSLPAPGISFYYGRTNVSCYGGNDGTAYFAGFYPGGSGTAPYTYLWAPGSQTTSAVSGLSAGNYTFTVTDAGACTSSLVVNISQPNQIMLSTTNNPNTGGCTSPNGVATVAVSSGGTGPFSYLWNTVPAQTTPAATNLLGGVYTCTVTDVGGCTSVATVTVTGVSTLTLAATASPSTICAGSSSTITASGATSYTWQPGGLHTSSITVSPSSTTVYTITGTTGACSVSITRTVVVNALPSLSVSPTSATLCSGQTATLIASGAASYTWSPTTGLDLTAINNATETASPSSSIIYTVTGTGSNGCTAQAAISITVFATPSLTISPATVSLCAGASATLTATGGTTYTWSPGTGLNTTSGSSVIATPASTTSYTVSSTNASGCTGKAVRTVSVIALPSVSVAPTTATICSGSSQTFTASGASTYSWTPGTGLSATTGSTVSASPGSTTIYTVTGTNASGCSAKAVFTLTVKPTPTVNVSPNPATYCIGNPVVLQASGATTYSWSPGTGLSATTGNSVSASPTITTIYTVTGTTNGCTGSATVQVIMSANTCTSAAAQVSSPTSYGGGTNLGFGSPASMSIMADITFTAGTNNITCNDIRIAPGKQIIVKNGATLNISASWLHSCSTCGSGMWTGIFVENGGHLGLSGYDVIEDAVNAVSTQTFTSGSLVPDLQIQATIFNKNTNAINLNLGNPNNVQAVGTANIVDNCVFTCRNLSSLPTPVPSITNFGNVKSALYNNTGTYGTTNTNAGVRSACGFSLTNAGTTTYPYVIGEAATTTTAGVGAINVLDYLNYGIWAQSSVFEVKNNFFQNLTGNNVSTPFGVGIYEATTSTGYPVSIGSSLTTAGANEGNVFKTCLRAIDLTGTDLVYIYNNTVNNAATSTYSNFVTTGNWSGQYGAFLKPAGTSTAVIHVQGNTISNCALGLHINRSTNYNGTSTTISSNTITAGGTSSLYCNKGVFLEDATGCSSCMTSRTMQVISNTITYAEDKAIHCSNIQSGLLIRCNDELSVTYKSVTNNTITTNATNDVIRLDNCKNTYTEYNGNIRTSGGNTSVANSNITGIFINNASATGNNNAVSFNVINYVGSCVVWEGDNSTAATFGYNQMKTGRHGLYMYTNAKFNNQGSSTSPSGNRWGDPALTNHTYVDNGGYDYNLAASIGKIYVRNTGVSGGLAAVPTVNSGSPAYTVGTTTSFGIIKISSLEILCASCQCDGGVRGERPAEVEPVESIEVVYSTMKPSNIQQVLEWNERSEGPYAREQQWSGEKWAYGLLSSDPSLQQADKDLSGFYARMHNSNIAKFTEAEADINAGNFESAAAYIQSIQPANVQEENLKQVYVIMLNLVQHPEGITDADKSTLWNIASQCEHTGGEAVVKARTLNNRLYNQAMTYSSSCEPQDSPVRQGHTATGTEILFKVYPNPGNGELTVDYDGLKGQDATLSIYDVSGSLLHSIMLPANSNRALIHARDLANGVYMYKVTTGDAMLKSGKIVILK